jgi:hypothetical protein
MPQPEGAALTLGISPMLTNLAVGFIPTLTDYVAGQILPTISVGAPSGMYPVWKAEDFLRRTGKELSNYEAPPVIGFATGSSTFTTGKWGVSANWTAQELAQARVGGTSADKLRLAKVRLVTTAGVIEREITVAGLVQTAANWGATHAGVTSGPTGTQFIQWDQTAADPVKDITDAMEAMRLATGFKPNKIVIPIQVLNILLRNASLIDRIKYGGTMDRPTEVTVQQLQALFKIDNIVVPQGVYNPNKEGAASQTFSYIWSKTVWLGHVTPTPQIDSPSAGYNFAWNGDVTAGLPVGIDAGEGPQDWGSALSAEGLFIRYYQTERPQARWVDCMKFDNPNVVAASLGVTFTAPVA